MNEGPDHEEFLERLRIARTVEIAVALRLCAAGIKAWVEDLEQAETPWEGHRFHDQRDVLVEGGIVLEVKSHRRSYTCAEDFPFPSCFVGSVERWKAREVKPDAWVIVSRPTMTMLALSARAFYEWREQVVAPDHRRGYSTMSYAVPREQLRTFDELVAWLRKRVAA